MEEQNQKYNFYRIEKQKRSSENLHEASGCFFTLKQPEETWRNESKLLQLKPESVTYDLIFISQEEEEVEEEEVEEPVEVAD